MIIGHKKQFSLLKNLFVLGELPHAFLFSGPESIGKKKVAIEFAKFINCVKDDCKKKPCNKCHSCIAIEKNYFPDLLIVEPTLVSSRGILRKEIKIIQIRKLKEKLSLKRYSSPIKIVIIDEAHYMNQEAQSALLKILEEPKGKTLFILVSHLPHLLLPTILSRLEELRFFPPSKEEIYNFLEKKGISENERKELYFFSFGKIGKIFEILERKEILDEKREILREVNSLSQKLLFEKFSLADSLIKKGKLQSFLELFLYYLRTLLIMKVKFGGGVLKVGEERISSPYSLKKIKKLLETTQRIYNLLLFSNVNPKIAIQTLLMDL